jgi:hypothetical protein
VCCCGRQPAGSRQRRPSVSRDCWRVDTCRRGSQLTHVCAAAQL